MKIELNRVLRQNYILKSSNCSNYNENNQLLSQQIKEIEDQLNSTTKLIESQLYEVQRLEVANCKQQTRLIAQLKHLQTECNILSSYKNIIGEILRRSPENILQVQSCTERHHNSILNQSDYQPRDSNSVPVKQHEIDSTFQKKRLLAFRQILKEEDYSFDAKTDDEINKFVREMPKTNNFWVRVGQMCENDSKKLRGNFNSQYKINQTNGQNSTLSNENEQTENSDQVILETHLQTTLNQNESNYHLNEQENRQASYSCKSQINRANMNEQQQIISERDLIEPFTQAFQLILKEAGYTINGDGQFWIWQAVKSLSTQQRNQLKLWDRVVQICKLRDNKVAQQFFKQQCRKLQALQNETNDHSLFQDDRSQQELDRHNSEIIDVAQDLAQLSQDSVCYQDKPNEIESIQCQEEIQGITRESQVQLPDTQIIHAQPKSTENLIQAEQHELEVKAQESQPVLENEQELEINIQTDILEQKARDLKTQIQVARAQFQDEQHKLKLAHETVKQLTAKSDMSISQSTLKETVGVQMKNDDYLPLIFEQPGQQHGDRKELLEQEIQHLQKQLELASKKIRNEQYKLKLVNETIANFICQNQQKTAEQNTLETHVSCVQQESYQKDIQESCSLSHQNLANDSHLSVQNQKLNLETSFNQLEPVPCDQQGNLMHSNNQAHIEPSQSDQLTSNNVQQPYQPLIQLDHQDDVLNESGQQVCAKQQSKQYSSQQLLLRLAVKQTLKEAGYEVESLSEIDICKTVHKLTSKDKRQLRFWDRVAQLCCRSKQQIVHFYRQTYKSSVYKNKPNQRAQVDNQEQLVNLQSDIQNSQKVNTPQKDGKAIIRKKRGKASPIDSQLMSFALRQVLTEIGIQVTETASDKDLCLQIDQISNIQKRQLKFWDRVSVLCQLSKKQVFTFYSRIYKPNIYTDKLNENDRAAIDEYIRQNLVVIQEASIYETAIQVMNSYFKDRSISLLDIKQYIGLNKSVIHNPSKLLTRALKQVLKEDGHQVETATDKEIYLQVNQITLQQKYHVKFWDRVSVLCEKSKSQTCNWYQKIIHNKKYYKLKDNDKAVIDQHIRQNQIVNINDTVLQIINTCFKNQNINMFDVQKYIQKQCKFEAINPYSQTNSNQLKANFNQTHYKQLLQALKQILKEVGYQVETASDKELCYHVDQMQKSQKVQYNFWERVSVVCQISTDQAYGQYFRYKQHVFTDKLNDEDKTVINEYIQQNREIPCDQTCNIILKTVLKDKNISFSEVQKYVQQQRYKQFESGLINPQTTQNVLRNQTSQLQLQHQTNNQLSGQSNINDQANNVIGQIATKSTGNHEYRFKLLSLALKQILKEDGYLAETASGNELCLLVDQMSQNDKILLNFWDRVSVLCQQPKETVKKFYYTTYKSTYHQQNDKVGTDKCLNSEQNISNIAELQNLSQKLTSAFKIILREEKQILDDTTDDEIKLAVKNMTLEQKQRLNFWARAAQICQVEVVKLHIIYSKLYINVVSTNQLNIKSQRVTNQQQIQKAEKFRKIDLKTINNLTVALKQILKQEGFQIQTSSARELCIHIDKIPESQIVEFKFWNRVSKLCDESESQIQEYYQSVYKQCIFTNQQHNDVETTVTQQLETNNANQQNENIENNEAVTEQQNVQSAQNIQTQIQHCEAQRIVSTSDCQNTKSSQEPTSAYSRQILLEQQSDAKTKLDRSEALNQIQPEIGSQQATETQKELMKEQVVMEYENHVIDISQDNVNSSMTQRQPQQIVETNTDKHKPYTEQNQEQNKPLTQNNVQPQKLTPCIQSKLRQQISLALKKVLGDSGYNVKNTTEKELCALVLFMTNKQKTEIDLWNRAAQICEINKTQLQKVYLYQYSTVLYSHGNDDNGVINNQKDTTAIYQNDTMSNQQQRSKDNEINIDQYMNTNQSLCQKNRHVMSNSLPTLDLEAMRESVDALVPKFVPIVQIQDQSLIQNKQNNYNLIHKLNMQATYTSANIMVPKYIPAIPQSIISDESLIQNTQNGVQVHQILPSLNINTVANTLVPNFVPTTQFANMPRKQTNTECKLMQQIPLALKKVLADSGYNVKDATEKELCALVMFMNFRQKTKIDLWNRVAQLCDVDKAELQKFFYYHYSTILYSHSDNNREYNNTMLTDLEITKFVYDKYQLPKQRKETGREQCFMNSLVPKFIPALPKIDVEVDAMSISELPLENDSYSV
ncbi:Hypothetical_protein [Hexamita inflata]|uniref:Hypothetical_protein n=1 Tax=Hexamita inflata TaxID=28002 RepID=A0AA86R6K2_9EUKA|nr:Hypothetical protein HINF_LOCUS55796 [Hexamita inflata]